MTVNDRAGRNKIIQAAIPLAALLLVLVFIMYALRFISKGWFSENETVKAQNNGVNIVGTDELYILKQSGGDDIDVIRQNNPDNPTADDIALVYDNESLRPGSFGSYTLYAVNAPSSLQPTYRLNYKIYPQGTVDTSESPYDTMTEQQLDDVEAQSITFVNKHIAFFTDYDAETKVFSGWIPGNTDYSSTEDLVERVGFPADEQTITIYWVWIEYYNDIGDDGEGPGDVERPYIIASADRLAIYNDMIVPDDGTGTTGDSSEWFYGESTLSRANRYNNADMYLANALLTINWEMEISLQH